MQASEVEVKSREQTRAVLAGVNVGALLLVRGRTCTGPVELWRKRTYFFGWLTSWIRVRDDGWGDDITGILDTPSLVERIRAHSLAHYWILLHPNYEMGPTTPAQSPPDAAQGDCTPP